MAIEIIDTSPLIIMLIIVAVCRKITSLLPKKTGIPGLVGWIILGIILAYPLIGGPSIAAHLQIGSHDHHNIIIEIASNAGMVLLIFFVGLKFSIKEMISVGKTAFSVAFFGVLIPFSFGFVFASLFYKSSVCALFLAASMVATSVSAVAYVLYGLHLFHTKEAKIIIGAAVIDDILGMIVLASVCCETGSGGENHPINILCYTAALIITTVLSVYFIIPWIQKNTRKNSIKLIPFIFSILFCGILAFATHELHLSLVIGAFMAGAILSKHAETWELNKKIKFLVNWLSPLFFICVGLQANSIKSDILSILSITAIIVVLAIAGKYLGCFIGAKIADKSMSAKSASIIGVGMIPRGEVGIIVASIGLKTAKDGQAIPNELYTAAILMCVITTIFAPLLLSILFKKKYGDNMKLEE